MVDCGAFQHGNGEVATVDQMFLGQQSALAEPGVDAGQGRTCVPLVKLVVAMSTIRLAFPPVSQVSVTGPGSRLHRLLPWMARQVWQS